MINEHLGGVECRSPLHSPHEKSTSPRKNHKRPGAPSPPAANSGPGSACALVRPVPRTGAARLRRTVRSVTPALHLPAPPWGAALQAPPTLRRGCPGLHPGHSAVCAGDAAPSRSPPAAAPHCGAARAAPSGLRLLRRPRAAGCGLRSALSGPPGARHSGARPAPAASLRPRAAARGRLGSASRPSGSRASARQFILGFVGSPCGRLRARLRLPLRPSGLAPGCLESPARRGGSPSPRPARCGAPLRRCAACPRSSGAAA